ncbi:hypothetical protein PoB_000920500, partial [Plakobranchus ocellatus]
MATWIRQQGRYATGQLRSKLTEFLTDQVSDSYAECCILGIFRNQPEIDFSAVYSSLQIICLVETY